MAQLIVIGDIAIQEGEKDGRQWRKFSITGADGSVASTFDPNASSLKAGDTIEAEIELRGKFTNLKSFKVVERGDGMPSTKPKEQSAAPVVMQSVQRIAHSGASREESIESQVAAKIITELRIAEVLSDKSPEFKVLLEWCRKRIGVNVEHKAESIATQAPTSTSDEIVPVEDGVALAEDISADAVFAETQQLILKGATILPELKAILITLGGEGKTLKAAVRSLTSDNLAIFLKNVRELNSEALEDGNIQF